MNNPIRTNKEDRYSSEESQNTSSQYLLINKKLLIVIVLVVIIAFSLIIFLITSNRYTQDTANNNTLHPNSEQITDRRDYQTLIPPNMSPNTTFNNSGTGIDRERLEVPDNVAEGLTKYYNANNSFIELYGQNKEVDTAHNEFLLGKVIENNHYTIQLIATSSLESIMAFAKSHKLSNYQIYETRRENKPWFVLIKGNFDNIKDAKTVIQFLPAELQKNSPWVKSGAVVNKEKLLLP